MINKHRGIIYKVCRLYGRDQYAIDDLFQDIVLQLWKSFPSFRRDSLPSTWMYRVALNTAISQFRKEIRRPERSTLSNESFRIPDVPALPEGDPHAHTLQLAIEHLSRIEKALVMLYLEEKSYKEIAEIMGITSSNVGVKLNRIKSKLEQIIKRHNYELG